MKKQFLIGILTISVLLLSFTIQQVTSWKIGNNYSVKFIASEFTGTIKGLKGTIAFNENDLANAKFNVSFDANTVDLGDTENTGHAKEKERLDAKNYPAISFSSSSFSKVSNEFEVKGNLTIKGITKESKFSFTFTKKKKAGIFKGCLYVTCADYKISEEGIGETIKIDFSIPVNQ